MMRGRENVHSCCPILDARDAHRFSLRVSNLLSHRLSGRNLYRYNNVFSRHSSLRRLVCSNIAQECTVTALYAIMIHSAYDMSLRDIADALDMSNNLKTIMCVLFDPLILIEQEGIIADQDCRWYKYRTANGERIRFSFINDGTLEYDHDLSMYITLFTSTYILSSRGQVYFIDLQEKRLCTQFIQIGLKLIIYRGLICIIRCG